VEIPYIHHGVVSAVFFFEQGKGITKKTSLSIQDEAHCSRRISMQRIHQNFADIWDHFWGVYIRVMPLISLI
jgi:hypothetical protein